MKNTKSEAIRFLTWNPRVVLVAALAVIVIGAVTSPAGLAAPGWTTAASVAGQMVYGGKAVAGKFDSNGRPVLQPSPYSPVHSHGPCGNVDMYFARDGEFTLVLNAIRGVSVGNWAVYSNGHFATGASGTYSSPITGYFLTNGQIFPGVGATGMGTDGWVVLVTLDYCYWPGGGQSDFGYWY